MRINTNCQRRRPELGAGEINIEEKVWKQSMKPMPFYLTER